MVITKKIILNILSDNKKYGLSTVSLTFPAGTKITTAALEAARGRIVLNVKKSATALVRGEPPTLNDYLTERASIAGASGTGESKRRGNSKYYSRLAKKRKSFLDVGNDSCRVVTTT